MQPQGRDRYRWIPWVLVPLMLVIYASHPTRRFYFDGVVFASIIEHGPFAALFNPHHLLYTWIFYAIERALERVKGADVHALYVMQWVNIILGAVGAGMIWRLVARLVADKGVALLVVLLGCFSFTYWHYATDADVYVISTLFLLLAADRLELVTRHRPPRAADFVHIGVANALSILFHQLNIFWLVCMAGCLVFRAVPGSRSERWRWWWIYLASVAIPVGAAYLLVGIFVLGHTSVRPFLYWITEYGHESTYWISSWTDIPLGTLNGYLMVFFHRQWIKPGILHYDLRLALEEGRIWKGIVKQIFGYYSLGFLFFCYLAALYNIRKYARQYPRRAVFVFSWLAPYALFQFFFMPMNYFYKLFVFVPLLSVFAWYESIEIRGERKWLKWSLYAAFVIFTATAEPLLAVLVSIFIVVFEIFQSRKDAIYRWGLFILVAFLALYNYVAGIEPESRLENNPEVVSALDLRDHLGSGDLLVFEGGADYPDGWIISALTPARVVTLGDVFEMSDGERDALVDRVREEGGAVYLHPNISEGTEHLRKCAVELGVSVDTLADILREYRWEDGFMQGGRTYLRLVAD